MARRKVEESRLKRLKDHAAKGGDYVLYWMQQSARAEHNPALEYAIQQANAAKLPLLVGYGLMDGYPEANVRHYRFLLEGLQDCQRTLAHRKIPFALQRGPPDEVALKLSRQAALVVCDRGYLRHQKQWRQTLAAKASCPVVQVEADVVVPVEAASGKAEYAARTLRPKIHRLWEEYLVRPTSTPLEVDSLKLGVKGLNLDDVGAVLDRMALDRSVPPVHHFFRGGTSEAKRVLRGFVTRHLPEYQENRPHPETDHVSHMSKYLHFGQISPVVVALAAREARALRPQRDTFLEELIVRRELAQNFAEYTPQYDDYTSLPAWARKTLAAHAGDKRPFHYTKAQLEQARTHDPYWNAAMREMRYTGYMHNAMRMYWGKKILEWGRTPEEAYRTALTLNNTYFLDGRDANSFTNIGWVFGLHDRPWGRRAIYGTVRSMSAKGLERKADMEAYLAKVDALVEEAKAAGVRFAED
ncbi:deoxyribodipyrimidine photo-lyase [Stigmatella aurantiaca]|uniref:Deoxyribodipyrimidine photo-lyase n=1 Tax=Stigmatella aurantiaca (strain DW4/3-1) TaxID=378806 RepID=Q08QW0_STIAD|nr:deoxyribodipyrimidine photo-lyase [Stigmatella aurantiaca]ADO70012.1 Deoxyribodipyrimidine photo-lyase [Stigmatella aurantiaca DW4/3-1]EAU62866.1 deoxyribodipyrimidine photo-lyase [Stigmatella aurantiaca DW4/3-1]